MFLIIDGDKPIYEYTFTNKQQKLHSYFSIHSALDSVDYEISKRREYYLGQLKNQEISIFCYINAIGLKLLLYFSSNSTKRQFDKKADSLIRDFFIETNTHLANALLNPLYNRKETIRSTAFEQKVLAMGKQYLKPLLQRKK